MLIGSYRNGNYNVRIYSDGTKIRETNEEAFIPEFPESMDLKITDYCNQGCAFCHENSTVNGKHGDILSLKFIDTLRPYTEIAIGGGDPLSHPNIVPFLKALRERRIIANVTVHQNCFMKNEEILRDMVVSKLIHGLGVSVCDPSDEFIKKVKMYSNAVIHIINGIISMEDLQKMYDNNLKILILGYKTFRRGESFYSDEVKHKMVQMNDILKEAVNHFNVLSFDNLAIAQLDVKLLMSEEEWNSFYMGDDGQFTMYVDAVKEEFARNSTSIIRYPLCNNIDEMFRRVRNKA